MKLSSPGCKELLDEIIEYVNTNDCEELNIFDTDFIKNKHSNLVNKIDDLAPIKFILNTKKSENELLSIFKEIVVEINKFDLDKKIDFLEKKLIDNMNEKTYQELLIELKKLANGP